MHEGYVHGLHSLRVREKHGKRRDLKRRRIMNALRRVVRDGNVVDNVLALVFDVGKVTGQVVAEVRARRGSSAHPA